MIAANELRIGNWVETYIVMLSGSWHDKEGIKHGQDVLTEPTIRTKQIDIKDLEIISSSSLATYRPIPLTPEILVECGFKEIGRVIRMESFDNQRRLRWDYEGIAIETVGSGWLWHIHKIKYLHQLQNLYFCLTNEELKIEL